VRCALFVLAGILFTLAGCAGREEPPQSGKPFSFHSTPEALRLQRVGILPFLMGDRVGRAASSIDACMASSLRELGYHEVMSINEQTRDQIFHGDVLYQNNITSEQLMRLRDKLHVDGVLIGRVEQFDSFDPIAMGVSVHLVSCLDGQVAWSATGHFDGRRLDVQRDVHRWYDRNLALAQASTGGWKLTLQTPSLFCRYVTDQLAASIP
jgi:hypothetical protein